MKKFYSLFALICAAFVVAVVVAGCDLEENACAASYGSYGGGSSYKSYSSPSYSSKSYSSPSYSSKSYGSSSKSYSSGSSSKSTMKVYTPPKSNSTKSYSTSKGGYKVTNGKIYGTRSSFNKTRLSYAPGYQRVWDSTSNIWFYVAIAELASSNQNHGGC